MAPREGGGRSTVKRKCVFETYMLSFCGIEKIVDSNLKTIPIQEIFHVESGLIPQIVNMWPTNQYGGIYFFDFTKFSINQTIRNSEVNNV
jgi:hypothetical protein